MKLKKSKKASAQKIQHRINFKKLLYSLTVQFLGILETISAIKNDIKSISDGSFSSMSLLLLVGSLDFAA